MAKKINWDDKEQVLKQVASTGYALSSVSKRLRDDEDVVKVAILDNPDAFHFASDRLKSDIRFVRFALTVSAYTLEEVSEELKNNEDIVYFAVEKRPSSFQFASKEKKSDLNFVLKLYKEIRNKDLYYIVPDLSKDLLDNKELGLLIVKNNGSSLNYLSPRLKDDIDVFTTALKSSKDAFQYGSERLKNLYAGKTQEILIVIDNMQINIKSFMTEKDVEFFKTQLGLATKYIKQSPISSFKKVLSSISIVLGTNNDIGSRDRNTENSIAQYYPTTKKIAYFFDKKELKSPYITLIHEIGHQFHHTMIKNGFGNQAIIELYKKATTSKKECELFNLPKIGDPLSELREDWWSVRMSSEDYVLTEISDGKYYYDSNSGDSIIYTKEEIIQMIACPSQYGAKNEGEFFAEMCVLITLGLVKPSQQVIANKFMEIINTEAI